MAPKMTSRPNSWRMETRKGGGGGETGDDVIAIFSVFNVPITTNFSRLPFLIVFAFVV